MTNYNVVSGVKKCKLCEKNKYTVDFANDDNFADKKLPVCIKCYRTDRGQIIVANYQHSKECKLCKIELDIADFSIVGVHAQNTLPHLSDKCRDCSSFDFGKVRRG